MKRFVLIANGDSRYLYDSRKVRMYSIENEDTIVALDISIEQLNRFCPYCEIEREFDKDIYGVDKQ